MLSVNFHKFIEQSVILKDSDFRIELFSFKSKR